jgi:hypothetical protein
MRSPNTNLVKLGSILVKCSTYELSQQKLRKYVYWLPVPVVRVYPHKFVSRGDSCAERFLKGTLTNEIKIFSIFNSQFKR